MIKRNKGQKCNNQKVTIDGITFDSKRESKAYLILKDLQAQGYISELELQPKYELIPAIKEQYTKQLKTKTKVCERVVQLAITYTADFRFKCGGASYVIDIKISPYVLPKEFVLKKKMMRYFHGIDVITIYKLSDLNQFKHEPSSNQD